MSANNIIKVLKNTKKFGDADDLSLFASFSKFFADGKRSFDSEFEEEFNRDPAISKLVKYINDKKNERRQHYVDICDKILANIKLELASINDPQFEEVKKFGSGEKNIITSLVGGTLSSAGNMLEFSLAGYNAKVTGTKEEKEQALDSLSKTLIIIRNFLDILRGSYKDRFYIPKENDDIFMKEYAELRDKRDKRIQDEPSLQKKISILNEDIIINYLGNKTVANRCVRENELSNNDFIRNVFDKYISKYIGPILSVSQSTKDRLSQLFVNFFINFVYAFFLERCYVVINGFKPVYPFKVFMANMIPTQQLLHDLPGVSAENFYVVIDDERFGEILSEK